jgi:hypothetical protein
LFQNKCSPKTNNMKKSYAGWLLLFMILTAHTTLLRAQTTVFTDDFNRGAVVSPLTNGGTPLMTWTTASTATNPGTSTTSLTTDPNYVAQLYTNTTTATAGRTYITGLLSTFSSPFNPTLSSNTGTVTWTFNMKTNRSTALSGFDASNYGAAVVLAATGADFTASGNNGYAVVLVKGTTLNAVKLVRFTNGLMANSNLTTIIGPSPDLGSMTRYVSVRVTYNPSTNTWQLHYRDDGSTTDPTDPETGTLTQVGTDVINTTYTGVVMSSCGFFWNHSNGAYTSNKGMYDNFKVKVTPVLNPTLNVVPSTLSGFNYSGTGPSASQSYYLSGVNLTGFPGNILVSGSSSYEVSLDNSSFGTSVSVPFTSASLPSTQIWVRLKASLASGTYNGETVSNLGGGVLSAVNVTCNGYVLGLPVTYTWNGSISSDFTVAGNWTPARTSTVINDILQFNDGSTVTVTNVPTQTIAQLSVSGGTKVTFQTATTNTLTIAGESGNDLNIAGSGSELNISGTSLLTLQLAAGATGLVEGSVTVSGAGHFIKATDPSGLVFASGGSCKTTTGFAGNVFGTTSLNSVKFQAGSTFIQDAGSNPFGAGAPSSVVVFETGSLYRFTATSGGPSYSGRTYANFEFDAPNRKNYNQGSNAFTCDNLTVTNGTLEFDFTGAITVKGNMMVNDTLIFGNLTKVTNVTMNGTAAQAIDGTGYLFFGANGTLISGNAAGVTAGITCTMNNITINAGAQFSVLSGTALSVTGALQNLNTGAALLGDGTISLTGAAAQTLTGQFTFGNLTINNAAGILLTGHIGVNGTMTLTSGLVTLGNYNLLMGENGAFTGTPSETAMIVATGTGQVQKSFAGGFTGAFTFPAGDNSVTAEYSPVTLTFTAGTFATGNYVGMNLLNEKHPSDPNTGSYLNRYWNLTQDGITGFVCGALFQYVAADVTGTEGDIRCIKLLPIPSVTYDAANTTLHQLTASGLTSFSTFIGSQPLPVVFNVSGSANYCVNASGAPVTLDGSETGVNYQLFKNSVAEGTPVAGTGAPLVWNNQLVGTYTVEATNTVGTVAMNGSAVIGTDPLPDAAGTITGASSVTQGQTGVAYSVPAIANATGYVWTLPSGAVITSGDNTAAIEVTFGPAAVSGNITVYGTNACGNGTVSADFPVTVTSSVPEFVTIQNVLVSSGMNNCYNASQTITVAGGGTLFTVQSGGEATLIAGSSIVFMPGTKVVSGGKMHAYISTTYCPTPPAAGEKVAQGSVSGEVAAGSFRVYPNPTQGTFTLEMTGKATASTVAAELFRMQGDRLVKVEFQGDQLYKFDLNGQPSGIYILRILFDGKGETVKIIKN